MLVIALVEARFVRGRGFVSRVFLVRFSLVWLCLFRLRHNIRLVDWHKARHLKLLVVLWLLEERLGLEADDGHLPLPVLLLLQHVEVLLSRCRCKRDNRVLVLGCLELVAGGIIKLKLVVFLCVQ